MPTFMTTAEVAAVVRAPLETVRYWRHIKQGPPSFKVGRRVLYDEAEVLAWIEKQRAAVVPDDVA